MESTPCLPDDLADLRRKAADYRRWRDAGYITEETMQRLLRADAKEMDRAMDCCVVRSTPHVLDLRRRHATAA